MLESVVIVLYNSLLLNNAYLMQHFLDKQKQWGRQEKARWDGFLDWLSDKGLLTTKVQSRTSVDGASLDDLRQGKSGEQVPRDSLPADRLFTNAYLP